MECRYGRRTVADTVRQGGGWGSRRGETDYPYGDATYTGFHVEAVEDKKVFEAGAEAGSVLISYNICDGQGKIWAAIKDLELRFLNGPEE